MSRPRPIAPIIAGISAVGCRKATLLVAGLAATVLAAGCSGDDSTSAGTAQTVVIRTVVVGKPGNAAAAIVPFHPGVYGSCADAPSRKAGCVLVGAVDHEYEIGELEVTVGQYVAFLNTVDPQGANRGDLFVATMSPSSWPKYGSIRRLTGDDVGTGEHYEVAYPEWRDKPIGFANFPRAAAFVNTLTNGEILSRRTSTNDGQEVVEYTVRLSRTFDQGMYDLRSSGQTPATRTRSTGFVVPSQDEWIKAAYYDPHAAGSSSYWVYPTGPREPPSASVLDADGDVVNAATQPLSTYSPRGSTGPVPTWCPPPAGEDCDSTNPLGLSASAYQSKYAANLSTVGQTRTRSPWGTLDQGGNAVEWTDTVALAAKQGHGRVWRRAHGGVANAPAYQLWISATGRTPEANAAVERVNPWQGFRVGVIGDPG